MKLTLVTTLCLIMAVPGSGVVRAADKQIDAEDLVKNAPVLSAGNEKLSSFHFIGEIQMPTGVPVVFEAGWSRTRGYSLAMVDRYGFPVLFLCDQKMLLYDVASGTVFLDDGMDPNVMIQVADGKGTATCGVRSSVGSKFVVDISSFAPTKKVKPNIARLEKQIEVRYGSPNGPETLYAFDAGKATNIKSMTYSHRGQPLIVIRDIQLNGPLPERLTRFPGKDQLPADLRVVKWSDSDLGSDDDAERRTKLIMRALGTPSALENAELRTDQYWSDVDDWDKVARDHKSVGKRLATILRINIENRQLR